MRTLYVACFALASLAFVTIESCAPDIITDGDGDGDADSDADADSDGDGDGDSDGDADGDVDADVDGDSDIDGDVETCVDVDGDGLCGAQDCDDTEETGVTCHEGCQTFHPDTDNDTYGDALTSTMACLRPDGHVENGLDCDDSNDEVNPDGIDHCGDGVDGDCDGDDPICLTEGDILITEIMQNPDVIIDEVGEWLELYNTTLFDIDLAGLVLHDEGTDSHTISETVMIASHDYVVLARSDTAVPSPDYLYPAADLALGNSDDEVLLETSDGDVIARVVYDGGSTFPDPTGASMTLDPSAMTFSDAQLGANWCEATSAYSSDNLGTPGEPNDLCASSGITAVVPNTGLHQGGLEVVISGAGLTGASEVSFGGAAATALAVVSDSELNATTPPHGPGWVDVTVTTPAGDLELSSSFLFTGDESPDIEWCRIQWPPSTTTTVGTPTEEIYGQVFSPGVTPLPGQWVALVAELGFGARGTLPSIDHGWVWFETEYNPACSTCGTDNDEYFEMLTVDRVGEYAFAFRFSLDGIHYRYCDTNGDDFPDYATADEGVLTVTDP